MRVGAGEIGCRADDVIELAATRKQSRDLLLDRDVGDDRREPVRPRAGRPRALKLLRIAPNDGDVLAGPAQLLRQCEPHAGAAANDEDAPAPGFLFAHRLSLLRDARTFAGVPARRKRKQPMPPSEAPMRPDAAGSALHLSPRDRHRSGTPTAERAEGPDGSACLADISGSHALCRRAKSSMWRPHCPVLLGAERKAAGSPAHDAAAHLLPVFPLSTVSRTRLSIDGPLGPPESRRGLAAGPDDAK